MEVHLHFISEAEIDEMWSYVTKKKKQRWLLKRLARKTICFSKSELMHDIVIGLFFNRYEFRVGI